MSATTLNTHHHRTYDLYKLSHAAWDYRGFTIRSRKWLRGKGYYAHVYKNTNNEAGLVISTFDDRDKVIAQAVIEIDEYWLRYHAAGVSRDE